MNRLMKSASNVYFPIVMVVVLMIIRPIYAAGNNDNLKGKVEKAITSTYDPLEFQIKVKTDNGLVTLNGEVNSLYDKYRIYDLTSRVQGVKKISNDIAVNTDMLPEKMIEADIRETIEGSGTIKEPQKINISVNKSSVKLSGNVTFYNEKVAAVTLASQTDGVTDIEDDITVTPIGKAVGDEDIKDYLNSILLNEFPLTSPKDLSISVDKGFVTIEGAVPDLWTKENIEKEFAAVAGVIRVINNLEVNPDLPNS